MRRVRYLSTISYIIMIVLINVGFSYAPHLSLFGSMVSPMDVTAGIVFVFRDFAQRELGHRVFIAMFVGCLLSYLLSVPVVALASVCAFAVAEMVDWSVFTFTRRPLSKRLLWSASISSPIDTVIFLAVLGRLNPFAFSLMVASKIGGVCLVWLLWRWQAARREVPVAARA